MTLLADLNTATSAIATLKTNAEAASPSTAITQANKELVIKLADQANAVLKSNDERLKGRLTTAGQ